MKYDTVSTETQALDAAKSFRDAIAETYGISGDTPKERMEQLKSLSVEGVAILLEDINKTVNYTDKPMISDTMVKIGGKLTIAPEHRYQVFEKLIAEIQESDDSISPERIADTLALGVVLLHPFKDGNSRTARVLGLMFRDEYTDNNAQENFNLITTSRDTLRKEGGWMVNGYIPRTDGDMSDPEQVSSYLSDLLHKEMPGSYVSCFGEAPLTQENSGALDTKERLTGVEAIYANYDAFMSDVADLRIHDAENIGGGQHSTVKVLEKDGKKYAVRVVEQAYSREGIDIADSHVRASAISAGMSGMEKIVAASKEEGITISEFATGSHVYEMDPGAISVIPDLHIDRLLENRIEAARRGILIDSHAGNILYDPEQGFTDIDFHMKFGEDKQAPDRLNSMVTVLKSLEAEEKRLYENDETKKAQYETVCATMRKRMAQYIDSHFSEEECVELRNKWKFSIAFQRAGHAVWLDRAKRQASKA